MCTYLYTYICIYTSIICKHCIYIYICIYVCIYEHKSKFKSVFVTLLHFYFKPALLPVGTPGVGLTSHTILNYVNVNFTYRVEGAAYRWQS